MWLENLEIVLPDRVLTRGALHIVDQCIAEIIEGDVSTTNERHVDCGGLLALPGIIDMHGDMLEIEVEPRPGAHFPVDMAIYELDKRLVATGVTTAYAAISFWETGKSEQRRSVVRAGQLVEMISALRPTMLCDLRVHARYEVTTPQTLAVLRPLLRREYVQLLSLMDHTPGQGQYRNLEQYVDFIAHWRGAATAEVEAETHQRMHAIDGMDVWNAAAELADIARAEGVVIASHDDDTPAKIAQMAAFGVTLSEFPVTLAAAQAAHEQGLTVAMGAPNVLRGISHSGNLSALEAIEAGAVDILAADYSPAALLHAVFALAERGTLPLHRAAQLVSQNVAAALDLHDRGRIACGLLADLVLVEPGERPRVRATLRQGVPMYWDGTMAQRDQHTR